LQYGNVSFDDKTSGFGALGPFDEFGIKGIRERNIKKLLKNPRLAVSRGLLSGFISKSGALVDSY
jgi:hypothetical protein